MTLYQANDYLDLSTLIEGNITLNSWIPISEEG